MKKDEIAIRSGVAGYLTDAATVGDRADSIEMRYEDENVWLTQKKIAALYDVSLTTNFLCINYIGIAGVW